MKCLTARNDDGSAYYPYCLRDDTCWGWGTNEKCDTCKFNEKVCDRLAAYEDTGLTPKQIRKLIEKREKR